MLNYYYITGTSRGIGKAMVEYLLKDNSNFVVGISRKKSVEHKSYKHVTLDLSEVNAVKDFKFENYSDAKRICLINNAGAIGMVKPVGQLSNERIINDYNLNLIAPCLLMNNFISAYKNSIAEKIIVNVSSGAGKTAMDGWSVYCTSKAGLDMFSKVIDAEQQLTAKQGFRIFSIAPGIVDTQMQTDIRSATQENFSRIHDFVNYKQSGQLADPNFIAQEYFRIFAKLNSINNVVSSVKDY